LDQESLLASFMDEKTAPSIDEMALEAVRNTCVPENKR
jgi:hypothetical protein